MEELKISVIDSVKTIYRRKNANSIINRLPPEIILIIIDFATKSPDSPRSPINNPVFQFNGRFRDVALAEPRVWSRIDTKSPVEAQELLKRSRTCLLEIINPVSEILKLALPSFDRWQSLSMNFSLPYHYRDGDQTLLSVSAYNSEELSFIFLSPAPTLKKLCVSGLLDVEIARIYPAHQIPNLFNGKAPKLHDLSLCWIPPLNDPLLSQLTRLQLLGVRTQFNSLIQTLVNCPRLMDLSLKRFEFMDLHLAPPCPIPGFPLVRRLSIVDLFNSNHTLNFLHLLASVPDVAHITAKIPMHATEAEMTEFLLPRNELEDSSYFTRATTVLDIAMGMESHLKVTCASKERGSLEMVGYPMLDEGGLGWSDIVAAIVDKISAVTRAQMQELHLDGPERLSSIIHAVEAFPVLTKLTLTDCAYMGGVLLRLSCLDPPVLPSLTHLRLLNKHHDMTYGDILLECLRKRSEGPCTRLQHLTFPWPFPDFGVLQEMGKYTEALYYTTTSYGLFGATHYGTHLFKS